MLYLISGSGQGAGKTYLANKLAQSAFFVHSLAESIRDDLDSMYPQYRWYNKSQSYKDSTIVFELGNRTIRQVLFDVGQQKIQLDPTYWVRRLLESLPDSTDNNIYVDDVRKLVELEEFRKSRKNCVHLHVSNPRAIPEPAFDNDRLSELADYVVSWTK